MPQSSTLERAPALGRPIVIIGAGRSGTNMIRDALTRSRGLATWPCDEINYIWRYGNRSATTDEFDPSMASARVVEYIRQRFASLRRKHPDSEIVEKTCANALRVDFVRAVVPEARFIHIIRDGRDVAASAAKRWAAELDLGYILRKARYVPATDVPYYAGRYAWNRAKKFFGGEKRLATWGPRFDGMESAFSENSLPVACAIQWARCLERASSAFARVPEGDVLTVRYEEIAARPRPSMERIFDFAGGSSSDDDLALAARSISSRSVGKWRSDLSLDDRTRIHRTVGETLDAHGYLDE